MGRLTILIAKKLNASSLTEVIVATSILLIVFAIAIATLNNIMVSSIKNNTQRLETKLEQFVYEYKNNPVKIPATLKEGDFVYKIQKMKESSLRLVVFSITNVVTKKRIQKNEIDHETE